MIEADAVLPGLYELRTLRTGRESDERAQIREKDEENKELHSAGSQGRITNSQGWAAKTGERAPSRLHLFCHLLTHPTFVLNLRREAESLQPIEVKFFEEVQTEQIWSCLVLDRCVQQVVEAADAVAND